MRRNSNGEKGRNLEPLRFGSTEPDVAPEVLAEKIVGGGEVDRDGRESVRRDERRLG